MNVATARRKRLLEAMNDAGYDHLLIFGNAWQTDYLRYAADFGILEGEAIAIVNRDGGIEILLDDRLEAERCAVECPDITATATDDLVQTAAEAVARFGNRHAGVAPAGHMPAGFGTATGGSAKDATAMMDRLLMVKAEEELQAIRRAAHLADKGYEVFRAAARAGRKDYELVAETEAFFRASGVDDNFMLIGSGGRELRGMTPPLGRVLQEGDQVTTELTPCIDGYYVQICRTLVLGAPSKAQVMAYDLWNRAMEAGIAAVRPGVTAADIARAENDAFRAVGLGEYCTQKYTRVRGHGLGLFVDTKPQILEDNHTRIEAGMVLIVHPNTYHPDVGYMVLGDSLIVTPDGAEVLTTTPRRLFSSDEAGKKVA